MKSTWNHDQLSFVIKEMQIETKIRYHVLPHRMATIKNTNNTQYGQGLEQLESSYVTGGNTYIIIPWKSLFCLSKNKLFQKEAVKIC